MRSAGTMLSTKAQADRQTMSFGRRMFAFWPVCAANGMPKKIVKPLRALRLHL
jgi:hypothetical protein